MNYREVLWRLGVVFEGAPAWLALRCDIDRLLVRRMAARVIRYRVERAHITFEEKQDQAVAVRAEAAGRVIAATMVMEEPIAHKPPRRTFVVHERELFEVPWHERPAPARAVARVTVIDASASRTVFGAPVAFEDTCVVHRGRTHYCASAVRVRQRW
jgi:hypothetical protein